VLCETARSIPLVEGDKADFGFIADRLYPYYISDRLKGTDRLRRRLEGIFNKQTDVPVFIVIWWVFPGDEFSTYLKEILLSCGVRYVQVSKCYLLDYSMQGRPGPMWIADCDEQKLGDVDYGNIIPLHSPKADSVVDTLKRNAMDIDLTISELQACYPEDVLMTPSMVARMLVEFYDVEYGDAYAIAYKAVSSHTDVPTVHRSYNNIGILLSVPEIARLHTFGDSKQLFKEMLECGVKAFAADGMNASLISSIGGFRLPSSDVSFGTRGWSCTMVRELLMDTELCRLQMFGKEVNVGHNTKKPVEPSCSPLDRPYGDMT